MFSSHHIFYDIGQVYVIILVLRAVFSWFPYSPDSSFNGVRKAIELVTEPLIRPLRRIIPPVGMFDISFLVALILVEVIVDVVLIRLP